MLQLGPACTDRSPAKKKQLLYRDPGQRHQRERDVRLEEADRDKAFQGPEVPTDSPGLRKQSSELNLQRVAHAPDQFWIQPSAQHPCHGCSTQATDRFEQLHTRLERRLAASVA